MFIRKSVVHVTKHAHKKAKDWLKLDWLQESYQEKE